MRQEQSRRKTPAARILSLALALCMIAAFVPAFTLTAGASDYTASELISMASYTFDGSYATVGGFNGNTSVSDLALSNITSPTVWTGWSATYDGTNSWSSNIEDSTSGININGITTGSVNYIQSYGLAVGAEGTITPNDDVISGTSDKDYVIIEWTSTASTSNTEHDYGLYDADGNVIDSWRILTGGALGPYYLVSIKTLHFNNRI